MANEKLGEAIHDHEIQTLPVNTFQQLKSSGVFSMEHGAGINNLLTYQMQVYHGIRGGSHLHKLKEKADFNIGTDAIMNERFAKLSDAYTNKTWEPTVKVPQQKRESPPAYEVKDDHMVCAVFLLDTRSAQPSSKPILASRSPTSSSSSPSQSSCSPSVGRQVPSAPFNSSILFLIRGVAYSRRTYRSKPSADWRCSPPMSRSRRWPSSASACP